MNKDKLNEDFVMELNNSLGIVTGTLGKDFCSKYTDIIFQVTLIVMLRYETDERRDELTSFLGNKNMHDLLTIIEKNIEKVKQGVH